MVEKTFEEGVTEGRLQSLEKTAAERGSNIAELRTDMTGMGESIRKGFTESMMMLRDDIKEDIHLQIEPLAEQVSTLNTELRGNGQLGLIKSFERYRTMAKLNWGLTSGMFLAIVAMALRVWGSSAGA